MLTCGTKTVTESKPLNIHITQCDLETNRAMHYLGLSVAKSINRKCLYSVNSLTMYRMSHAA